MKTSKHSLAVAAALAGLVSGSAARATGQTAHTDRGTSAADSKSKKEKHGCKGQNSCKGKGGCASGDNGCKGKNSCKGKGGCATNGKM
jgi:hypothetical protein